MRTLALVILLVAACGSKETSSAGPVGKVVDVRSHLKAEQAAKAPADDKATKHEYAVDVHGVKAKLVWRTFEDGANKLIVSYNWEVITPSPTITLEPMGALNPENAGTEAAVIERLIVRVRWHDNSSSTSTKYGEQSFSIDAAGVGKPV
ncbi:MAG: hypothetical protein H0T79_19835 [Deltaproteobacteria bacterium]|nr:hypothetical protein [Deltaproteobacteria bacterium]